MLFSVSAKEKSPERKQAAGSIMVLFVSFLFGTPDGHKTVLGPDFVFWFARITPVKM